MSSTASTPAIDASSVNESARQALGMVPNLITEMSAHNPTVARAYLDAGQTLGNGLLTDAEEQVVILAISGFNHCHYCTKAHAAAGQAAGLSDATVRTIVDGGLPDNSRHRHLVQATRRIMSKRGWLSNTDTDEFSELGIDRDVLYEIVGLIGLKTISNYINHIAGTEVDEAFL